MAERRRQSLSRGVLLTKVFVVFAFAACIPNSEHVDKGPEVIVSILFQYLYYQRDRDAEGPTDISKEIHKLVVTRRSPTTFTTATALQPPQPP
jgi:hypothetical protein